jgi:hypothetical protein
MGGNRSASTGGMRSGNSAGSRGVSGNHSTNTGGMHAGNTGSRGNSAGTHASNTGNHGSTGGTHASNTGSRSNTGGTHAGNTGNRGNTGGTHASNASHATGKTVSLKGGGSANLRSNGSIRSVNRNGMHISRSLNGSRTVVGTHGGARVVNTGAHGGYVQHGYGMHGGRAFVSRTFVYNHVAFVGVYHSFGWHGFCCYFGYYPGVFWAPAFYGWAWNPWPAPVYWGWGWGAAPWYGYYGWYFQPYPVYPAAAFWLTDYLIAANLQAAYAAQAQAAADAGVSLNTFSNDDTLIASTAGGAAVGNNQVALSPEIKRAITEEVKAELTAEQAQAAAAKSGTQQADSGGEEMPAALDPARRIFVVASDLTVEADGQECSLTAGDVVTRISDTPDANKAVSVSVSATKKKDCALGKTVAVSVDDLQEMHNQFLQKMDQGLKQLAKKQGTGGLPKAPDAKSVASDVPPPAPDKQAAELLDNQAAEADKTEADVKQQTSSSSAGGQN